MNDGGLEWGEEEVVFGADGNVCRIAIFRKVNFCRRAGAKCLFPAAVQLIMDRHHGNQEPRELP